MKTKPKKIRFAASKDVYVEYHIGGKHFAVYEIDKKTSKYGSFKYVVQVDGKQIGGECESSHEAEIAILNYLEGSVLAWSGKKP